MQYGPLTAAIDKLVGLRTEQMKKHTTEDLHVYRQEIVVAWGEVGEAQNQLVRDVIAGRVSLADL